ncbi:hypothetical protein [Marinicellulosiphila megalodicopiae]
MDPTPGWFVCINKQTGEKLWGTKLKRSTITNVYYEDANIYAYSGVIYFV